GHAFAAIDGALALKERMGVAEEEWARVRVGGYRARLEVAGIADPTTAAEARFSTPYLVATALTHGSVRLAAFEPARLQDPATRSLMRRVEVVLDPALHAAFQAQREARVANESRDGRRGEHLQPTRQHDTDMPLPGRERASEECGARGVPVATIFSDGFAVAGPEGAARQARLIARARELGVRVLGPNSMGLIDVPGRVALTVNAVLEMDALPAGTTS